MELSHRVSSDLPAQLHRQSKQNNVRENFHPSVLSQMGEKSRIIAISEAIQQVYHSNQTTQ